MTQTTNQTQVPASSRRKADWPRAWRSLRALIANPERTDQVATFISAIGGQGDLRALARFRAHPSGQRLLAAQTSLPAILSDLPQLATMPAGSLGRAYADFMQGEQLDPNGIVEEFRALEDPAIPIPPDERWFFERLDVIHDLWHVLTGYGRDQAGEAANLAFTFAQFPTRGIAVLIFAAILIGPKDLRFTWPRYLYQAWRRGRLASDLLVVPYELLLPLPLEDVRNLLGIVPAAAAHAQGIFVGNRSNEGRWPELRNAARSEATIGSAS